MEGESDIPASTAGLIVSFAVFVAFSAVAVITAAPSLATPMVGIAKLTELCPAGIVTEGGTVAPPIDDFNWTRMPPDGAIPVSPTVAEELAPPARFLGCNVTVASAGASTETVTVLDCPLSVPEMVADFVSPIADVEIGNEPDFVPLAMYTVAGTTRKDWLEANVTASSGTLTALDNLMVPMADVPPTRFEGETVIEVIVCENPMQAKREAAIQVSTFIGDLKKDILTPA